MTHTNDTKATTMDDSETTTTRRRRFRLRRRDERGAVAVETAFVLPLLLILVIGIIQFGLAFNAKLTVAHAAREGARVAIVDGGAAGAAAAQTAASSLGGGVSASGTDCSPGSPSSVTVSYPYTIDIPFVGSRSVTLSSTAVLGCA